MDKAKKLEGVALAELQILDVYHASQKGIYSTSDLIERADHTLPDSIRAKIPAEAVEELRQSGRCLAFDSFTASGFHMMRAAEAVLYEYDVSICKPKTKKKLDNWGAYILALRKWQDEKSGNKSPDVEKVIAVLQQIEDQDRNLIMHPELVLSGDDAFTLFEVGQGAIIAMAARLKPKAPRKPSRSKVVGTGGALRV